MAGKEAQRRGQGLPEWPLLEVSIRHRIGALTLNVEFQLSKPWTVLFAPSGAGKTTVLRTIAGLVHAEEERVIWTNMPGVRGISTEGDRVVLADTTKTAFLPAHARRLPMMMQNSTLFPQLSVAKNVSYSFRGTHERFAALLKLCQIEHLVDKMPAQVSGGERQRIALARTLGANGRGVLLDEPFAGIDVTAKDELMREVKAWLGAKRVPVLHVTHDVGEVFAVADEVIRLSEGRLVAQGTAEIVLREERQRLAGWLGL